MSIPELELPNSVHIYNDHVQTVLHQFEQVIRDSELPYFFILGMIEALKFDIISQTKKKYEKRSHYDGDDI